MNSNAIIGISVVGGLVLIVGIAIIALNNIAFTTDKNGDTQITKKDKNK